MFWPDIYCWLEFRVDLECLIKETTGRKVTCVEKLYQVTGQTEMKSSIKLLTECKVGVVLHYEDF